MQPTISYRFSLDKGIKEVRVSPTEKHGNGEFLVVVDAPLEQDEVGGVEHGAGQGPAGADRHRLVDVDVVQADDDDAGDAEQHGGQFAQRELVADARRQTRRHHQREEAARRRQHVDQAGLRVRQRRLVAVAAGEKLQHPIQHQFGQPFVCFNKKPLHGLGYQ